MLFRRICGTLLHHSSVISSSKRYGWLYANIHHYKQINCVIHLLSFGLVNGHYHIQLTVMIYIYIYIYNIYIHIYIGGTHIMAIIVGNGHGNPSSNLGQVCLHFA